LKDNVGSRVRFERVLLLSGEHEVRIGNPVIGGVTVEATILGHFKGDKVTVFKKKRRKGYRVKRGHRQSHTRIHITGIAT
jgi:large subunit ribosomal protein L21